MGLEPVYGRRALAQENAPYVIEESGMSLGLTASASKEHTSG